MTRSRHRHHLFERHAPAPFNVGDRIRLIAMRDDPDPLPAGSKGKVIAVPVSFQGSWQVCVQWDNGRSLDLCVPPDIAVREVR